MADLVENRSASWQPRELEELLEGVQQNYEVLWGKLSGTLSKKDKDRAWSDIVQSINSVGGNERNVEDSMKKWCDWKSRTIMKDAKRRRFVESSGEAALPKKMQLTVLEDKLLSLVPKTKLFGVQGGGIDTGPLKRSMQENDNLDKGEENKRLKQNVPSEPVPIQTSSKSTASIPTSNSNRKTSMKDCDCHQEMIDISRQMLEESVKRNEILRDISSTLKLTAGKAFLDNLLDPTNF
ncbi:nuclear apoptosis-inducing factor 1-like isoform X1 [Dreissena polymorpha]|nr:nuclear apoptosis-inducing factor 1-like isoform X1 [Dreissena polymorpha]